jgi:hypothetical protein
MGTWMPYCFMSGSGTHAALSVTMAILFMISSLILHFRHHMRSISS